MNVCCILYVCCSYSSGTSASDTPAVPTLSVSSSSSAAASVLPQPSHSGYSQLPLDPRRAQHQQLYQPVPQIANNGQL
jgi:hypothetical protein